MEEALIVLASVERGDERDHELVAKRASVKIAKLFAQVKATTTVLPPFAHLLAELGTPEVAIDILIRTRQELIQAGLQSIRTPFGWFDVLQIDAKGDPLLRVLRPVTTDE